MESEFKNVLITGGCGFIGSNVVNYLVTKYPHVNFINVDKLDYCSSLSNVLVQNHANYKFIKLNLLDEIRVCEVVKRYRVDAVIHFAAQSHVDNSFLNANIFVEDNIMATISLLNACVKHGCIKKFVHVSTDEVYGESIELNDRFDETTKLNPTNPYSASKASAEYFVKAYHKCYLLPVVITRANNVFGPRQYFEKLIPKFIKKLLSNEKCTIHGNGLNTRNFVFVDDVARAFELILMKGKLNEIYNIGTDNEFSVLEVTEKLVDILKPDDHIEDWIEYVNDRPWNDCRYAITNAKILNLGWKEQSDFESSLLKTIEWYKNLPNDHWDLSKNPYSSESSSQMISQ